MKVLGMLWLHRRGQNFLGPKRLELLEKIQEYGSLSRAANAVGMSYKAAWDMIDKLNQLSPLPLVLSSRGGKEKGGTQLTAFAQQLVAEFRTLEEEHQQYLVQLSQRLAQFEHLALSHAASSQVSEQNQLCGKVTQITQQEQWFMVSIGLQDGSMLTALLTQQAAQELNLQLGQLVYALIPSVLILLLLPQSGVQVSYDNQLSGDIIEINPYQPLTQVIVELSSGELLTALISFDSLEALQLQTQMPIRVAFDASHVTLAVTAVL